MENKSILDKILSLPVSIIIALLMVSGAWIYNDYVEKQISNNVQGRKSGLEATVLPYKGVVLPVKWRDLGKKLVEAGVIDAVNFKALYESRGEFGDEQKKLLYGHSEEYMVINSNNASYILNLLWALGLSNENPILEDSLEMKNPQYGGAGNFASTGGWSLAAGDVMDHYGKHKFINLTPEQQAMVEKVSKGIYRPCCNNATHFPDCNHGMAMLGLLELMASQGVNEEAMWQNALAVNSYWFPSTYLTIASYMQDRGIAWQAVKPQEVLGINYSSVSGYTNLKAKIESPKPSGNGGGCGV